MEISMIFLHTEVTVSHAHTLIHMHAHTYVTVWQKPNIYTYKLKYILLLQLIATPNNYVC